MGEVQGILKSAAWLADGMCIVSNYSYFSGISRKSSNTKIVKFR